MEHVGIVTKIVDIYTKKLQNAGTVIVQEVSACFTIQDRMSQRNFFNKDPSGSILGMEQFQVIKEGNR